MRDTTVLTRLRRRWALAATALALLAPLVVLGDGTPTGASVPRQVDPAADATVGPIRHVGRWLVDADGRALLLNGVNFVDKSASTPEALGFGEDDAAWLAANGIDAVRLGFSPRAIMPKAGVLDTAYIDSFVKTVRALEAHGLMVLIDLHQDGWGPAVDGNGFPDWMTLTHGATNTHTGFPLYYVTNPAIQASFQSFWGNEKGPGGVPLQNRVATMFTALATQLADDTGILGYDLINEPWPGTDFSACAAVGPGCPDQDHKELDPYYARMATAIRSVDPTHMLFGEPWVLFNFGQSPTSMALPGADANSGMSFHMYTVDTTKEPVVVSQAQQWSARTGGALLATEFGASADTAANERQIDRFDDGLVPWMFWSYDEELVRNLHQPPGPNVVASTAAAVIRPHPLAVAGTPTSLHYDRATQTMRFSYSTAGPGGATYPEGTVSTFQVAPRTYPGGYSVEVDGGTVTSAADASTLTVLADPGAASVSVVVHPTGQPTAPEPPSTSTTTVAPAPPASPSVPVVVPDGTEAPPAEPVSGVASFTG